MLMIFFYIFASSCWISLFFQDFFIQFSLVKRKIITKLFMFIIDSEFYIKKKLSISKTISSVQCQAVRDFHLKEEIIRRKTLIVKLNSALNVDYYCSDRTQRISRLELLFLFSPEKLSIAINDKKLMKNNLKKTVMWWLWSLHA